MRSNYKRLGDYVRQVKVKNTKGLYDLLLGINIDKYFMPSVANVVGTNLNRYKVVKKNQFACNRMHVGRDYRIPMALSDKENPFIVSPAYTVFEILDESHLLPEYLMMWFSRPEFDRECWFHTDADVRGGLPWDLLCDVELPIPSIEKQQEIVNEYNTIVNRIKLNEQLNQKLEETAQALYKHWFVDFEFPSEEGKPYKTSGDKMVYNEELDKEIPEGWVDKSFTNELRINGGGTPKTGKPEYWNGSIPFFTPKDVNDFYFTMKTEKYLTELGLSNCSSKLYEEDTIFITARGTVGAISLAGQKMAMNQSCYAFIEPNHFQYYGHQLALRSIYELKEGAVGAVFKALVTKDFNHKSIVSPKIKVKKKFNERVSPIYLQMKILVEQNIYLFEMKNILLAKMTKVEEKNLAK